MPNATIEPAQALLRDNNLRDTPETLALQESPRIAKSAALDWSTVKKVLLVRLRSIGDTVLMTACLDALKRWRADLDITVVMEPLSAPLLSEHPLVDTLLVIEKTLSARAKMLGKLRAARFDVAFNMHGGERPLYCLLYRVRQTASATAD